MFLWTDDKILFKILKQLRKMNTRTIRPIAFNKFLVRKEGGDVMALIYNVTAGPVSDKDIVERRLAITVNGETRNSSPFAPDVTNFGELSFSQGDNVVISLVDVDDAGNVSQPATLEFTAADTIAPAKPGEFGVTLSREE
jgi:hypothetical protein